MKLLQIHEAKHIGAGTFESLMKSFFSKTDLTDKELSTEFSFVWMPNHEIYPIYKEYDVRGKDHSVCEEIAYIAQDAHPLRGDHVWIEYDVQPANGDWMTKDHAMKHIIVRDDRWRQLYP